MSDSSSSAPTDDVYYAKLVARADGVAQRVVRAIGVLSALDEQLLLHVFGLTTAQVSAAHAYAILGVEPDSPEVTAAIDRCAANMLRAAASLRKQNAANQQFDARTTLLLDDLQILHREFDFLQKFLVATDPLAEMGRKVYQERFVAIDPAAAGRLQAVDDDGTDADPAKDGADQETEHEGPPGAEVAAPVQMAEPASQDARVSGAAAIRAAAADATASPNDAATDYDLGLILSDEEDGSDARVASGKTPAAQPAGAEEKVTITCSHCGQRFAAAARLIGTKVRCLSCKRPLTVTRPEGESQDQPPVAAATPTTERTTPPPAGETQAKIRITCGHCRQQFNAPSDLAGRSVGCSACGKPIFVPPQETAASLLTAYEGDPLSNFGDLDDYMDVAYMRPPAADYRPRAPVAYAGRPNRYRRQDEELPRWVWYAMGAALGICVLVFLAIVLISAFGRDSSRPTPSSEPETEQAPAEP